MNGFERGPPVSSSELSMLETHLSLPDCSSKVLLGEYCELGTESGHVTRIPNTYSSNNYLIFVRLIN